MQAQVDTRKTLTYLLVGIVELLLRENLGLGLFDFLFLHRHASLQATH